MDHTPIDGRSPLLEAINAANLEAVKLLLALGANPSLIEGGLSPLSFARALERTEIVEVLRDAGAQ